MEKAVCLTQAEAYENKHVVKTLLKLKDSSRCRSQSLIRISEGRK
jgi:hypothetical protein